MFFCIFLEHSCVLGPCSNNGIVVFIVRRAALAKYHNFSPTLVADFPLSKMRLHVLYRNSGMYLLLLLAMLFLLRCIRTTYIIRLYNFRRTTKLLCFNSDFQNISYFACQNISHLLLDQVEAALFAKLTLGKQCLFVESLCRLCRT